MKSATQIKQNLHLHPYLTTDSSGLATFRDSPTPHVPELELTVPVVKFHATTRTCPIHGEQEIVSRNFQPEQIHSSEGLACGHSVLISRDVKGLRKGKNLRVATLRDWKFLRWRLSFKEPVSAS